MPSDGSDFAGIETHSLLSIKLESRENISVYIPHRVLRQFGFNQRTVQSIGDVSNSSVLVVEDMFVGTGRLQVVAGVKRLFCPGLE